MRYCPQYNNFRLPSVRLRFRTAAVRIARPSGVLQTQFLSLVAMMERQPAEIDSELREFLRLRDRLALGPRGNEREKLHAAYCKLTENLWSRLSEPYEIDGYVIERFTRRRPEPQCCLQVFTKESSHNKTKTRSLRARQQKVSQHTADQGLRQSSPERRLGSILTFYLI